MEPGPAVQNWNNPHEDGFSFLPVFWASLVCLPAGFYLIVGAIAGQGRRLARARAALAIAWVALFLVIAFLIFQRIANGAGG